MPTRPTAGGSALAVALVGSKLAVTVTPWLTGAPGRWFTVIGNCATPVAKTSLVPAANALASDGGTLSCTWRAVLTRVATEVDGPTYSPGATANEATWPSNGARMELRARTRSVGVA